MSIAIITPGNGQSADDNRFDSIQAAFEAGGHTVVRNGIEWQAQNMEAWVAQTVRCCWEAIAQHDAPQPLALFGFSMGGMISLLAAAQVQADFMLLASPAGLFQEFVTGVPAAELSWASTELLQNFRTTSWETTRHSLRVNSGAILAGEKELIESPQMQRWITRLHQDTSWPLTKVPDAGHDIRSPHYETALIGLIRKYSE